MKSSDTLGIVRKYIRQDFDGNVTVELRIVRAIDLAHTALAEKGRDFERAKSCTYIYRHRMSLETQIALAHYADERQRKQTQPMTLIQVMGRTVFIGS